MDYCLHRRLPFCHRQLGRYSQNQHVVSIRKMVIKYSAIDSEAIAEKKMHETHLSSGYCDVFEKDDWSVVSFGAISMFPVVSLAHMMTENDVDDDQTMIDADWQNISFGTIDPTVGEKKGVTVWIRLWKRMEHDKHNAPVTNPRLSAAVEDAHAQMRFLIRLWQSTVTPACREGRNSFQVVKVLRKYLIFNFSLWRLEQWPCHHCCQHSSSIFFRPHILFIYFDQRHYPIHVFDQFYQKDVNDSTNFTKNDENLIWI